MKTSTVTTYRPTLLQPDDDAPADPGTGIVPGAQGFWGEPADAPNVMCRLKLTVPCPNPRPHKPYCGKDVNRCLCVCLYMQGPRMIHKLTFCAFIYRSVLLQCFLSLMNKFAVDLSFIFFDSSTI